MEQVKKLKIGVVILLLLSILAFIFPIVKFSDINISIVDMISMSSDITQLMDEFGASSQLVSDEINSYFIIGIVMFLLPIVESILLLAIQGKLAFVIGLAGTCANNVMGFIVYDKISDMISFLKEAVAFFSMDMQIETLKGTVGFWCILYIGVIVISLAGLLKDEFHKNTSGSYSEITGEIFPEEIRNIPGDQNSNGSDIPAPECPLENRPFYGGIIGNTGIYKNKVRLLKKEETLVMGTDREQCNILLGTGDADIRCCRISYDESEKEYHVKPFMKNCIFLKSGQPLGKDRVYCIPRGTVIFIENENNSFQLA